MSYGNFDDLLSAFFYLAGIFLATFIFCVFFFYHSLKWYVWPFPGIFMVGDLLSFNSYVKLTADKLGYVYLKSRAEYLYAETTTSENDGGRR